MVQKAEKWSTGLISFKSNSVNKASTFFRRENKHAPVKESKGLRLKVFYFLDSAWNSPAAVFSLGMI